jgi:hypothetical protein
MIVAEGKRGQALAMVWDVQLERKIAMIDKRQNPTNDEQTDNRPLLDGSQLIILEIR